MGAVKILACDSWFSKCVREAAEWRCQRCQSQHEEGTMGLHCAHFHSRGHWGTRFEPFNCAALCYGCHSFIDREPMEKLTFFTDYIGCKSIMDILQEKANSTKHGLKKLKKEISSHYRQELTRIKGMRANGVTGKIDIIGFV